jgi:hypothetical protein
MLFTFSQFLPFFLPQKIAHSFRLPPLSLHLFTLPHLVHPFLIYEYPLSFILSFPPLPPSVPPYLVPYFLNPLLTPTLPSPLPPHIRYSSNPILLQHYNKDIKYKLPLRVQTAKPYLGKSFAFNYLL